MSIDTSIIMQSMQVMAEKLWLIENPGDTHRPRAPASGDHDLINSVVRQHGEIVEYRQVDDSHIELTTTAAKLTVEIIITRASREGRWYWALSRARPHRIYATGSLDKLKHTEI